MVPLSSRRTNGACSSAASIQRARLLNLVSPTSTVRSVCCATALLPPALVLANPAFLRPCHGVRVPRDVYLHLHAVDLARAPDGQWWVLADRTQAPSGAGYALENRIVLSRSLPEAFRDCQVQRLASFFRASATRCAALAPTARATIRSRAAHARAVQRNLFRARLPGALSRLHAGRRRRPHGARPPRLPQDARRPAAGRRDLAPPRRQLLRSAGAARRFVSRRRRPGRSRARRQRRRRQRARLRPGRNARRSSPFFPALCRRAARRGTAAADRCRRGGAASRRNSQYVLEHLDEIVVKPAFPPGSASRSSAGSSANASGSELVATIRARPYDFVAQEQVALSTAPVWNGNSLEPRRSCFAPTSPPPAIRSPSCPAA